jgi:hypothetical protein
MQRVEAPGINLKWLLIALGLLSLMIGSVAMITLGTRTGLALGVATIGIPIATYLAITRPILFPFGLYVVLVPFDNLLVIPHWGTLTKLAAICSGAAIAFWMLRKKQILPLRQPLVLWGILILWAAASFSWALDVSDYSVAIFATLVQLFLLYAALSLIPVSDRDLRVVSFCVILGATAAAAYGIYLFSHGMDIYKGRLFIEASSLPHCYFRFPSSLCGFSVHVDY